MTAHDLLEPMLCPTCGQPLQSEAARAEAQRAIARLEARITKDADRRLKQGIKLARETADKEYQARLAEIETELETVDERAAKAAEKEYESLRVRRDKDWERKLRAAETRRETETKRLSERLTKTARRLQELQDSAALQVTPQEKGRLSETALANMLTEAFPSDRIERVRVGQRGSDVLHYVVDDEREVGLFVYESKHTAHWSESLVTAAEKTRTHYDSACGFLISRSLPEDVRDLSLRDGIVVVAPDMVTEVVGVVREVHIGLARLRQQTRTRGAAARALTLLQPGGPVEKRLQRVTALHARQEKIDADEREAHARIWTRRSNTLELLREELRSIQADIAAALEG